MKIEMIIDVHEGMQAKDAWVRNVTKEGAVGPVKPPRRRFRFTVDLPIEDGERLDEVIASEE